VRFAAIAFDFDGVVADTESLANQTLADALTRAGMPTTREESFALYMGHSWADNATLIEQRWGRLLPPGFVEGRRADIRARLHEVTAIPGIAAFLDRIAGVPRAIASSSSREWIDAVLNHIGLASHFPHIFSVAAGDAPRGKPAPDIYRAAFAALNVAPDRALVIEDTPVGVSAGAASGAFTVGLCAGSHVRPGHADLLTAAGANAIAESYEEVAALLGA
jgi:HAD superfamily hydrolase (TIGR01509 family)